MHAPERQAKVNYIIPSADGLLVALSVTREFTGSSPRTLTDFIPFAIKPLHLQVIDKLQRLTHVDDSALLDAHKGTIVSANKSLASRLSSEECRELVRQFKDPNAARTKGTLEFLGTSYQVLRADLSAMYCQTDKKDGLILVAAGDYIVMITYNASMVPSISVEAADKMGKYFTVTEP